MFLIKSITNIFFPNPENEFKKVNELLIQNEKSESKKLLIIDRTLAVNEKDENEDDKKKIDITDCFKRTGIITQKNGDRAVINNVLHINIKEVAFDLENDLEIGSKINYLAYNASNSIDGDDIRVRKILEVTEYTYEEPTEQQLEEESSVLESIKPEYFSKHKRNYFGYISKRTQFHLTVNTNRVILIEFEAVSMNFSPQIGDQVVVQCYVQTDDQLVDTAGEILEILKITPQRIDTRTTKIIDIGPNYGILENEDCYFLFDILNDTFYKPCVGDLVEIECIESSGNYCNYLFSKCTWRCTKIKLLLKAVQPNLGRELEENVFASWISNKNGIEITENLSIKFTDLGQKKEFDLEVKNNGNKNCTISYWQFKGKKNESQLKLIKPKYYPSAIDLDIGEKFTFIILAEAMAHGFREEYFEIKFMIKQSSSNTLNGDVRFKIGRKITVDVGDPFHENYETKVLRYSANCKNNNRLQSGFIIEQLKKRSNIVPGVSPSTGPRFIEIRIGNHSVPDRLQDAVAKSIDQKTMRENVEKIYHSVTQPFNFDNYVQKFECLLHLEEIEYCFQMRFYDCERAHFIKHNEYLRLNIDNLAERRPSLIIGDSLQAIPIGNKNSKNINEGYQAFIHKVLSDHILVKFNPNFHEKYNGEDYRLYFDFSRSSFRKKHHAILEIKKKFTKEFLFPTKLELKSKPQTDCILNENYDLELNTTTRKFNWFNPNLNEVQKIAITNILRGEARPIPYVIFGPPGTGKTITVIETILQLFTNCSNSRILVAAPSNSAADLIATRLINLGGIEPGCFLRIISHNIVQNDIVPTHLKPYSATIDITEGGSIKNESIIKTESGLILKCSKTQLCACRILIGTCMSLATLMQIKFPPGHFTHVIIDEAGQCTEPEIMSVICQVDNQNGQVVLAGDPLQLGPIIINKYAAEKGLDISYLSRLLSTQPYSRDKQRYPDTRGYNKYLVTKLIYNYRSIPSILRIFNDLFYDDELLPTIDDNTSKEAALLKSLNIPQPDTRISNFGVIFYAVRGENLQDSNSPSWYNAAEAYKLVLFTIQLMKEKNVSPHNIGIITPYNQQVRKIRLLLQTIGNLKKECIPKVGSVEEFQGQERDIILISTVRSSKRLIATDLKYTLGFIQSEKRMNVAISRAKSLLVIFGNPLLLQFDPNWKRLIQYCINNNSTSGCETLEIEDDSYDQIL